MKLDDRAVYEAYWLRNMYSEITILRRDMLTLIQGNNERSIGMIKNPQFYKRSKNILALGAQIRRRHDTTIAVFMSIRLCISTVRGMIVSCRRVDIPLPFARAFSFNVYPLHLIAKNGYTQGNSESAGLTLGSVFPRGHFLPFSKRTTVAKSSPGCTFLSSESIVYSL